MLGLGSSMLQQQKLPDKLSFTYTDDFDDDGSGWVSHSIEGGNISFAYDQDIPSGSGGGWMKCTYPNTNQTNSSGIIHTSMFNTVTDAVGQYARVSCKVYLYDDGSGLWGSDPVKITLYVDIESEIGDGNANVPLNQEVELDMTFGPDTDGSWLNIFIIYFNESGELPQANAVFYVKDLVVDIYTPA